MRKVINDIHPVAGHRHPRRARAKAIAASKVEAARAAWLLQVTGMSALVLMVIAFLMGL